MDLIPAIDIIDGKCVRLTKGDFGQKKVYRDSPLEAALEFEDAGIKRLHLVDLDGARSKKVVNIKVLETIAQRTDLIIDFGGGVQTTEDLTRVLDAGASQVTGGSVAVKDPRLFRSWLQLVGPERLILGADVIKEKIAVSGWQERTSLDLWKFLECYLQDKVQYVICTDVDKDGLLAGPSIALYEKMVQRFPTLFLIASGGVTTMEDLHALQQCGVQGAIIGKALYEGKIGLHELRDFR